MYYLFAAFSGILIFQLVLPFLTVVAARLFGRDTGKTAATDTGKRNYACIVTAYKNAAIAIPLVQSLLRQRYPHFYIYLVADECPADFDPGIQDAKLTVFQPDPPLRLKVKSIIYAMERLVRSHDYIAVFDADNLAHPDFLTVIDQYAAAGHHSIQGQRTAKNTDNAFAAADSVGELYKNYIERYAPWLLGSSAVISGSGMAVETGLYQAYLQSPAIQEGQHLGKRMLQEDKILQNFLLLRGESIAFAQKAVCYDEKIQNADAVQTQRSRWLFSYFQNLPNTLRILISGIIHLDWNRFFFGLVTLSLPMFIQVGLAFLLFILGWFVAPVWSVALTAAVTVFAFTVLWTLSLSGAPGLVRRAFIAIPTFIWRQMRALLGMRNPDKNFKHTEHTKVVTVDEVLGGEE
jgi:cellulose synthase/poly-beta-1,6-N-acetylglucosamine synthase-like glycosyltransferase